VEGVLVTVPTAHLGYVTQFPPERRKRHRQVIVTVVRRIVVDPITVRYVVLQATWSLEEPWWRRLLSRRHRDTTDG
jgi:hypothetical protein